MSVRLLAVLLLIALAGCGDSPTASLPQAESEALTTPTPQPTPTLEPTVVPESAADSEAVGDTVRQFADAIARQDEIVVLLTLSPGAQHIAAADNLDAVFGWSGMPQSVEMQDVELDGDLAVATCVAHFEQGDEPLHLRLLRLEGTWKIDGVQDAAPD